MASTGPCVSPGMVGNPWILSFFHSAGLIEKEGGHAVSSCDVSASPTNSPRPLIATATPLFPPNVGSVVITPPLQTTGRQIRKSPQKFSPDGSAFEVSDKPATSPRSLIDSAKLYGNGSEPPSVPRSVMTPRRQRKACNPTSPAVVENPTTHPLLFTPKAWLKLPPSVPKSVSVYRTAGPDGLVPCSCAN